MKNKRIVVELTNNLTFTGLHRGEEELGGRKGIYIETDKKTGLRIWCPKNIIKELIIVPTGEGGE